MKAVFGVVSLIVALAIVAFIARKQVQSSTVAGAVVSDPSATVASQAKGLQDKARSDVSRAVQDGAQRNVNAER